MLAIIPKRVSASSATSASSIDAQQRADELTTGVVREARRTQRALESWSMSRQDFAVGLAQVFGRHVQIRYLRDSRDPQNAAKFSARASMACRSREDDMSFEVIADVASDGGIRLHGGNWLWHSLGVVEMAEHFALEAEHAYARRPL